MKKTFILIGFILILLSLCSCNKYKKFLVNYYYQDNLITSITYNQPQLVEEITHFIPGKVFSGYYLDDNYNQKIDIENFRVEQNTNIYLKYQDNRPLNFFYLPLDNRPVNQERAILLSKAIDINLILPEEDLYRTYLDNQLLNANQTQFGDPKAIKEFITKLDLTKIDAFIISLDQLLSGGLVASRADYNQDINDEIAIIEEILAYLGDKPLYIFDTIMRLAPTVGYNGYGSIEYTNLRNYAMQERYPLATEDLTIDNIRKYYNMNPKGKYYNLKNFNITETMYENYVNSRIRKLTLTAKIITKIDYNNVNYICGVDDSSATFNIQMNEINYLKKINPTVHIFPGADELGLLSIAKAYQDFTNYQKLKVNVNYFGKTAQVVDQAYDGISLDENIKNHLQALDLTMNSERFDLEVLVLTKDNNLSTLKKSAKALVQKMENNFVNNIPTCIIDINDDKNKTVLADLLFKTSDLSLLLGYSSWNTVGNAIGLSLSMATARLSYLKSDYSLYHNNSTANQISLLAFSLIKDITYKVDISKQITSYIDGYCSNLNGDIVNGSSNFYQFQCIEYFCEKLTNLMNESKYNADKISELLSKNVYCSLRNDVRKEEGIIVNCSNYRFPWYRTFEITFNITSTPLL